MLQLLRMVSLIVMNSFDMPSCNIFKNLILKDMDAQVQMSGQMKFF